MKSYFFPCLLLIFSIGCGRVNIDAPKVKLADYTFETTPNDLDNVGYVFAVDRNKMQIPVTMLDLQPKEGIVEVPKNSRTKEMSFGALIKFLGLPNLNLPANAGLSNTTKITTVFELNSPKISRAFLTRLDSAIAERKQIMGTALKNQNLENADVYVVFETIKASKITYDFSKSKVGKANLDLAFKDIASMNDSMTWNNSGSGSLSYDLKKDLNVFYKIFKIDVLPGAAGPNFKRGELIKDPELVYTSKK